jgi:hypothetical protein
MRSTEFRPYAPCTPILPIHYRLWEKLKLPNQNSGTVRMRVTKRKTLIPPRKHSTFVTPCFRATDVVPSLGDIWRRMTNRLVWQVRGWRGCYCLRYCCGGIPSHITLALFYSGNDMEIYSDREHAVSKPARTGWEILFNFSARHVFSPMQRQVVADTGCCIQLHGMEWCQSQLF